MIDLWGHSANHGAMTKRLTDLISRHPIAFDRQAGGETRLAFQDLPAPMQDLIEGVSGCSPFLRDLLRREADWFRACVDLPPETALSGLLADLDGQPLDQLGSALRQAKRRLALLTAVCDLGGIWPLMTVTGALTRFADLAVDLSIKALVGDEIRRGRLPGATPDDLGTAGGMVVLAMGKMGAGELNYSSDIDLICLFDQDRYGTDWQDARAAFIRVTRKMSAILSDFTHEGYVFRTDLRLRPDASVMPVCLSMHSAFAYYEAEGRTWERAAYIKARACAGDLAAGNRFLTALTPFVWRKHLDFAAIQDAHDMRLRIREHRGLKGAVQLEGHNLKLGVGGIREIEFFAQTRQLIAGGRDHSLREKTTLGALAALAAKGWIEPAVQSALSALYTGHRELEHRIQMVGDAQTHDLPVTADGIARIAALMGEALPDFRTRVLDQIHQVDRLTDGFFAPVETDAMPQMSDNDAAIIAAWESYPCLRSERAQGIFRRLRPGLLRQLQTSANPQEALVALDGFFSGLPSGVQIFSLFQANPLLVELIVDIAATAPKLARYLARNASVLDAVIGGSFFAPWPGTSRLTGELIALLAQEPDYERKLDLARRWHKEWHFRVGVHHLRGLIDAFEAGKNYADLAEAVISALWPSVEAEFVRRHGHCPGGGAVLLAMGSLGAGRLNAGSDLDLIMIYDAGREDQSDGPKPLAVRQYFSRLTQAIVTAISVQTAEGRLYEVDVRLRPSGRQGPVATSIESWMGYQLNDAWTWEHLALTRARVIVGQPDLAARVETARRDILKVKSSDPDKIRQDVQAMRERLFSARPGDGPWEAKFGPGRMMDLELVAQMIALLCASPARQVERQIHAGVNSAILSFEEQNDLLEAVRLQWRVQCSVRALTDRVSSLAALGQGGCVFVLREAGESDADRLSQRLGVTAARGAQIADRVLGNIKEENDAAK